MHEERLASDSEKFKCKMLDESSSLLLTKQVLQLSASFQSLVPNHALELQ